MRVALGCTAAVEGRALLLFAGVQERAAAWLRDAGASQVVLIRREREEPVEIGAPGGMRRSDIRRGVRVAVVQKADQETGKLTVGVVRDILTSSPTHPRGIKVRLESGEVGRVRRLLGGAENR